MECLGSESIVFSMSIFGWTSTKVALDDVALGVSFAIEVMLELETRVVCELEVSVSGLGVEGRVPFNTLASIVVAPYTGSDVDSTRRKVCTAAGPVYAI